MYVFPGLFIFQMLYYIFLYKKISCIQKKENICVDFK